MIIVMMMMLMRMMMMMMMMMDGWGAGKPWGSPVAAHDEGWLGIMAEEHLWGVRQRDERAPPLGSLRVAWSPMGASGNGRWA